MRQYPRYIHRLKDDLFNLQTHFIIIVIFDRARPRQILSQSLLQEQSLPLRKYSCTYKIKRNLIYRASLTMFRNNKY